MTTTTIPLSADELTALALILTSHVEKAAEERRTFALDEVIGAAVLACADQVLADIAGFHKYVGGGIVPQTIAAMRESSDALRDGIADSTDGIVRVYPRHGCYLIFAVKLVACLHEVEGS